MWYVVAFFAGTFTATMLIGLLLALAAPAVEEDG